MTVDHSAPLLQVDDLYWSAANTPILENISFAIESGQFVGLIGPNGAGKSSLMRCLYGVNHYQRGSIALNGQPLSNYSVRQQAQQISVILQEHTPHLGLSVYQVVEQGLAPHKSLFAWNSKSDLKRIHEAMAHVEITELTEQPFSQLSGGEKQRVMLARAMVQDTPLLLLDEPTNHLDVHYQIDMLSLVKRLGKTVLASIHDLNLAASFCDYLLVIDKGKIIAQGKPYEILTENLISSVFKTCVMVDSYPLNNNSEHIRITYAYPSHDSDQHSGEQA
ncbi:ABC transporter ATP-binding protein [Bermanella sp. R86510]|uniref:ABC transporter ATP-binding protein n=1 Tax=unclassified Bermanella TaxID=2627862 RepID=UPI0037CCBAF8